jgi:hypothetical protein
VSSVKQVSSVGSTHARAPPMFMRSGVQCNAGFMRSLLTQCGDDRCMGGFCNSMAYYSIAYMAYNSIAQHSIAWCAVGAGVG